MSGRLEEAAQLSCELYGAGAGHGSREFGMGTGLAEKNSSVWLPHNLLEWALKELEEVVKQDQVEPHLIQVSFFKFLKSGVKFTGGYLCSCVRI
jgi:hypothetical protein